MLFVLLPGGHNIGFETFLAIYIFAVMLGVASHAPGGLGVFEATILLALSNYPREPVLGALLLYRLCYYLVPFVVALAFLGAYEIRNRIKSSRAAFKEDEEQEEVEAALRRSPDDTCLRAHYSGASPLRISGADMSEPTESRPDGRPERVRHCLGGAKRRSRVPGRARGRGLYGSIDAWLLAACGIVGIALSAVLGRQSAGSALSGDCAPMRDASPGVADAVLAHIPDPGHPRGSARAGGRSQRSRPSPSARAEARSPTVLRSAQLPSSSTASTRFWPRSEPLRVEYSEHVPTERTFEVHIGPLRSEALRSRRQVRRRPVLPRSHVGAPARGHADGFRRQCQPRTAHAAGVAARLHRDPAGPGAQRRRRRGSAFSTSCASRRSA